MLFGHFLLLIETSTKGQIVQSVTAAARIAEILLEQIFQWAGARTRSSTGSGIAHPSSFAT